jgi:hypothetical protein
LPPVAGLKRQDDFGARPATGPFTPFPIIFLRPATDPTKATTSQAIRLRIGGNPNGAGAFPTEAHAARMEWRQAMDKTIPAEKAKQGRSGRHVLIVLVAALILAMAAWYGAEFYAEMIHPDNQPTSSQTTG